MNRLVRVLVGLAIVVAMLSAAGCTKLKARDQLNKGVQSYKNNKYEEAIEHFKNAVNYDPTLLNARLYLATAYATQYVPGSDTPDNLRNATSAIDEFKKVLEQDPKNVNSIKGIASLYLQMKDWEHAKEYYNKGIQNDPNDPELYYSIAFIDWTQAYAPRMEARAKIDGLKAIDNLDPKRDKKVCEEIKVKNQAVVEEGIKMLDKALQLRPDYDDAMAYMNLMYRERADYECDDLNARKADLKTADEWVDKTMATKKAKAEKAAQPGGIVMDQNK